jgi:hypothetical protein
MESLVEREGVHRVGERERKGDFAFTLSLHPPELEAASN